MKLFAIDMDGTCLNSRARISAKTMDALRQAAAAGIEIVPATGRTLSCLPHQLKKENFIRYVISSNGAVITDIKLQKVIHRSMIPTRMALDLLAELSRTKIGICLHAFNKVFFQGNKLTLLGKAAYGQDACGVQTTRNILDMIWPMREDIEEIQLICFSLKEQCAAERILDRYPELTAIHGRHHIEIISGDTDKGQALRRLREYLSTDKEQSACIGNAQNDLAMFRESGTKLAVRNAIPELKELADHIVRSNAADGVAEAVSRYILPTG